MPDDDVSTSAQTTVAVRPAEAPPPIRHGSYGHRPFSLRCIHSQPLITAVPSCRRLRSTATRALMSAMEMRLLAVCMSELCRRTALPEGTGGDAVACGCRLRWRVAVACSSTFGPSPCYPISIPPHTHSHSAQASSPPWCKRANYAPTFSGYARTAGLAAPPCSHFTSPPAVGSCATPTAPSHGYTE